MLFYYVLPAGLVFLIALRAFWVDQTAPKTHLRSWVFVVVAALLWPVTLPFILWKKVVVPLNPQIVKDTQGQPTTQDGYNISQEPR